MTEALGGANANTIGRGSCHPAVHVCYISRILCYGITAVALGRDVAPFVECRLAKCFLVIGRTVIETRQKTCYVIGPLIG